MNVRSVVGFVVALSAGACGPMPGYVDSPEEMSTPEGPPAPAAPPSSVASRDEGDEGDEDRDDDRDDDRAEDRDDGRDRDGVRIRDPERDRLDRERADRARGGDPDERDDERDDGRDDDEPAARPSWPRSQPEPYEPPKRPGRYVPPREEPPAEPEPAPAPAVTRSDKVRKIVIDDDTYYLLDPVRKLCFLRHKDTMTTLDCAKIPEAQDFSGEPAPAPAPAKEPARIAKPLPPIEEPEPEPARSSNPTPDEISRFESAFVDIFCDRKAGEDTTPDERIKQRGLSVDRYEELETWWANDEKAWWTLTDKARKACSSQKR